MRKTAEKICKVLWVMMGCDEECAWKDLPPFTKEAMILAVEDILHDGDAR